MTSTWPVTVCSTARAPRREVVDLNDAASGVVAFDCPTGADHFGAVAHELFEALGQTSAMTGNRARATRDHIPLLVVSLLSRPVTHVVVDDAQRLGTATAVTLAQTCLASGSLLTLAIRGPAGPTLGTFLAAWPHHTEPWTARLPHLRYPQSTPTPDDRPETFPGTPHDEFPHFLSACRARLDPEGLADVAREHHRVRDLARAELSACDRPGTETVLAVVRRLLRDATGVGHAVLVCRAVSAAAFPHRVLLTADAATLAARIRDEPWFRARTCTNWDALHRYRRPSKAAVTVLAAAGVDAETATQFRVADTAALEAAVPAAAAVHLRRQRLQRLAEGASDDDPFLTLADGRPATTRWVRETLLATRRTFDGPAERARRTVREPDHPWARRLGITARRIT